MVDTNLPDGVKQCDIPGSRPIDKEWADLYDWISELESLNTPQEIRLWIEEGIYERETKS